MPIYEYQCQSCGKELEVTQRITEAPLVECPACQKPSLQRLISSTSFQLKGGGWYKDGYGSGGKKRTDNDRIDRVSKAIDDDKKKSGGSGSSGGDSSSSGGSSGSSGGSSSSSGGSSGTSSGASSMAA
jgi:putative FmdB family regulatory protein